MTNPNYFEQALLPASSITFRMARVPAGQFRMGSSSDDPDAFDREKPPHFVRLDGFWMAEIPVTQALWEAVIGANPANFKGEQRPMENVSWFDAAVFCNALSKMTNRSPVYLTPEGQPYGWDGKSWALPNEGEVRRDLKATGFRLPTEAEWEYAAREAPSMPIDTAPEIRLKYAGSDLLDQVGWYQKNSGGETHEVGLLLPNALGLYDMSGNVFEWCEDWYSEYTVEDQTNPRGPDEGVRRVLRGGDWGGAPQDCRSASRGGVRPGLRDLRLGFRLVLQSVG